MTCIGQSEQDEVTEEGVILWVKAVIGQKYELRVEQQSYGDFIAGGALHGPVS